MPRIMMLRTDYGPQYIIVDDADADLVHRYRVNFESRQLNVVVRPAGTHKQKRLQQAVARRYSKPPSENHKFVRFRNGFPNDFRAANLYWATRAQLKAKGNTRFRQDMAFELSAAEGRRRKAEAAKVANSKGAAL